MYPVSKAYKNEMQESFRGRSFIRVTMGVINQVAQVTAVVDSSLCTYYSNTNDLLNNNDVKELYATTNHNYSTVDGGMYFLPQKKEDIALNAGVVSKDVLGCLEIFFPEPQDIKGLTVDFGKAYPLRFAIEYQTGRLDINNNDKAIFVTEHLFTKTTFLRFIPLEMVNGKGRLHIHKFTAGIGVYFDNNKVISATKKEHMSPISEDLPTIDFDLTVDNTGRVYDIENENSLINFLEVGQFLNVLYGQELFDGTVEWLPGATLQLKEWSADDSQMRFSATDRFDWLEDTYYNGCYYPEGVSLYELAEDVLGDAKVDGRDYWLDLYLKDIIVKNPIPPIAHKEALQLIANAGRCIIYQDRVGKIIIKSSFIPAMKAVSNSATYFSNPESILENTSKKQYALTSAGCVQADSNPYFLPKANSAETYLNVGYVSQTVADGSGRFSINPSVTILLEASYKCFGINLEFENPCPEEMVFNCYLYGELKESYIVGDLEIITRIGREFTEFNKLVIEFTKGSPHSRVQLKDIRFGDSTDYTLTYRNELVKTPNGIQLPKTSALEVLRQHFNLQNEEKELDKVFLTPRSSYTFYLTNPAYNFAVLTEDRTNVAITKSSAYLVEVDTSMLTTSTSVILLGREYNVTTTKTVLRLNTTGVVEVWQNPLVSNAEHAEDLAKWVGDHLRSDKEYSLSYRGDPKLDVGDIAFLENKYNPNLLVKIYDHTLNFNGSLSGTIKARRDMENVAATQNKLGKE